MRTVFLFSGQGSQYFQMGRALYDMGGTFTRSMRRMDDQLKKSFGISVIAAIYGDRRKSDLFDDVALTHPAIFMTELALAHELTSLGLQPHLVLGASLGSFAAATVAARLDEETALSLVARQAQILARRCPPGMMVAVLAPTRSYEETGLKQRSVIASTNMDSHFVLSAPAGNSAEISAILKAHGLTSLRLPVRHAYHSEWIDEAREDFESTCAAYAQRAARIPIVCCSGPAEGGDSLYEFLWAAVRRPIGFQRTVAQLEQHGPFRYVDLSPSGTLATFLKHSLPANSRSTSLPAMTPYGGDLDTLAKLLASGTQSSPA